jgi:hypothetical protein
MKIKLTIFLIFSFALITACSNDEDPAQHKELKSYLEETVLLLDKTDSYGIRFEKYQPKDEDFYISIPLNSEFDELNKRKQFEALEQIAQKIETFTEVNETPQYTYVSVHASDDVHRMNISGEPLIDGETFEKWMNDYYKEDGTPVFYPSYYDPEAAY